MRRISTLLAVMGGLLSTSVAAQPVPGPVKSAAFLETIATRGVECDLLQPWQASALRALNLKDMERWSKSQRDLLPAEIEKTLAQRDCTDEAVRAWIEASSRGFDSEMLPPYLIVYRTLAASDAPPEIFTATTTRLRYGPAIEAINAKLSALEASGARPEGGGPWPDYIAGIEKAAREFNATLTNENAPSSERYQASIWIAQSAHIIELWLLTEKQ